MNLGSGSLVLLFHFRQTFKLFPVLQRAFPALAVFTYSKFLTKKFEKAEKGFFLPVKKREFLKKSSWTRKNFSFVGKTDFSAEHFFSFESKLIWNEWKCKRVSSRLEFRETASHHFSEPSFPALTTSEVFFAQSISKLASLQASVRNFFNWQEPDWTISGTKNTK